jgi:hypothetical protein
MAESTSSSLRHRSRSSELIADSGRQRQSLTQLDEDLVESGLRNLLPSKAQFFRSHLCRACKLYLVDYGTILERNEAEHI